MASTDVGNSRPKNLRLFVAFPLPKGLWKDAEAVHLNNKGVANIRWTPLQNLHITIFFLGEVHASNLDKIKSKIRDEVSATSSFKLDFEKIAFVKGRKHSGMIWMQFFKNEFFSSLSNGLEKVLQELLMHTATIHDPIPHVTLARWKGAFATEEINSELNADFLLPEIKYCELWQSISSTEGVKYISLDRFEIGKSN